MREVRGGRASHFSEGERGGRGLLSITPKLHTKHRQNPGKRGKGISLLLLEREGVCNSSENERKLVGEENKSPLFAGGRGELTSILIVPVW